jgi:hypothetical protein
VALRLEDRIALDQLYAQYWHALDFDDRPESWLDCFDDHGVWRRIIDGTVTVEVTGRAELLEFWHSVKTRSGGKNRHLGFNLVIEEDADGNVTGSCYNVMFRVEAPSPGIPTPTGGVAGAGKQHFLASALLRDKLTFAKGRWKFLSREITLDI